MRERMISALISFVLLENNDSYVGSMSCHVSRPSWDRSGGVTNPCFWHRIYIFMITEEGWLHIIQHLVYPTSLDSLGRECTRYYQVYFG